PAGSLYGACIVPPLPGSCLPHPKPPVINRPSAQWSPPWRLKSAARRVASGTSSSSAPIIFFFSSRRRHTRSTRDWSSDVCSSDLLPPVDFPTIQVTAQYPGAAPDVMASSVTTPLERQFGQISGLALMTSISSFGNASITLQFNLDRDIDAAAQDVQAAMNAVNGVLPRM